MSAHSVPGYRMERGISRYWAILRANSAAVREEIVLSYTFGHGSLAAVHVSDTVGEDALTL